MKPDCVWVWERERVREGGRKRRREGEGERETEREREISSFCSVTNLPHHQFLGFQSVLVVPLSLIYSSLPPHFSEICTFHLFLKSVKS
jgi:hypothetical protein